MPWLAEEQPSGSDEDNEQSEDQDTDEEVDKREYGIHQCLPVDDAEPDWETEEPQTVEEYLRRVRYEARQLPDVVSSVLDPNQLPAPSRPAPASGRRSMALAAAVASAAVPPCPPDRKPSIPWIRQFLQQFSELRQQLQREHECLTGPAAPASLAQAGLQALSLGCDASPSSLMPELLALRGLGQLRVLQRLQQHGQRVLQSSRLTAEDSALLYALSARVERPLHGDTCALFRALLRHCATLRAELPDARHPLLPHLNVLIAIAGGYFGQDEELAVLWEEEL